MCFRKLKSAEKGKVIVLKTNSYEPCRAPTILNLNPFNLVLHSDHDPWLSSILIITHMKLFWWPDIDQ